MNFGLLITSAFLVTACIVDEQLMVMPPNVSTYPDQEYDPLAVALASIGQTVNFEASVPPQCYTKTDAVANPCWTCHTTPHGLNHASDWELQEEYSFSDFALTNHWKNLYIGNF